MISDKMLRAMEDFTRDAVESGGYLLYGGERMARRGYFFKPTVILFEDGNVNAKVLKEEVFGPIMP